MNNRGQRPDMTQRCLLQAAPHTSDRLMKSWMIVWIILTVALLWFLSEPVPQNLLYHNFADQRSLIGVPHALNVLSNAAFCLAGIWGGALITKREARLTGIEVMYLVFFVGVFFTGLGSANYHWSPENTTLVWDRLPMTVGFMALTSIVVSERYSASFGYNLFPWLLAIGILSVVYWAWQEDLRPYLLIQYGLMLILPVIILRFSGPGTHWLWLIVTFYFAAKLLELFDHQVFQWTEGLVSGHTLKHLAAAAGTFMIVAKVSVPVAPSHSQSRTTTRLVP